MKKNMKFLYDLGDIPDKYIEKALDNPVIKPKIIWRRTALVAACALLVFSLSFLVRSINNSTRTIKQEVRGDNKMVTEKPEPKTFMEDRNNCLKYASMSADEATSSLTLEQKVFQMIEIGVNGIDSDNMLIHGYGAMGAEYFNINYFLYSTALDELQKSAVYSKTGIPFLFGLDSVNSVNYCRGAVIFPYNIGLGAANDPELVYKAGLAAATEAEMCHIRWNYSPCISLSDDPRWGRTCECFGSDHEITEALSTAYTKGLTDGGMTACARHYFDCVNLNNEKSDLNGLPSGNSMNDQADRSAEILKIFKAQIDSGVQSIMISHNSLSQGKITDSAEYIKILKEEYGFKGITVSDLNELKHIEGLTYREKVINAVNSGIDMLLLTDKYDEAAKIIIDAVNNGIISSQRIDDAVSRIMQVKLDSGLFDDPFLERAKSKDMKPGSAEYREIAEKLVEESLVLLKNEKDVLPIKRGMSVYITGLAANNSSVQCGCAVNTNAAFGTGNEINGVTTILEGFENRAEEFGINVIADRSEAANADIVLLAVGEVTGKDTDDPSLYGNSALQNNANAIEEARALGKPVVTCIIAGRHVFLKDEDLNSWDGVVMCYLPGSEGQGIADVLCGKEDFSGTLPSPWYSSTDQIGTNSCRFEKGYGLKYNDEEDIPRL